LTARARACCYFLSMAFRTYVCGICGYVYDEAEGDPEGGLAPGTRFEDIPEDWVCPECGAAKTEFTLVA
jgi:rubredoxin---NAD+ reductase